MTVVANAGVGRASNSHGTVEPREVYYISTFNFLFSLGKVNHMLTVYNNKCTAI